jgi:flagellin-like protein
MKMKNKNAVSAVIGVILMVAITVAIAATVYVYVASIYDGGEERIEVSGNVTKIVEVFDRGDVDFTITFDYNDTYIIVDDNFDWVLGQWYKLDLVEYEPGAWTMDNYIRVTQI